MAAKLNKIAISRPNKAPLGENTLPLAVLGDAAQTRAVSLLKSVILRYTDYQTQQEV